MRRAITTYLKYQHKLKKKTSEEIRKALERLQEAISAKDSKRAKRASDHLIRAWKEKFPTPFWKRALVTLSSLTIALTAAIVIRQMWFEPMEIPSGSMRPTYKESDRLAISKIRYGINIPLLPRHLYFNKSSLHRGDVVVFTSEGMAIPDQDVRYYGFPCKKRLIKRCIGLPGDTLYFYGGQIFGIDHQGQDISREIQSAIPQEIDHVPFLHLHGNPHLKNSKITSTQMGIPICEIEKKGFSTTLKVWDKGNLRKVSQAGDTYLKHWGIDHFATLQLLTPDQVRSHPHFEQAQKESAELYLELSHHPHVTTAQPFYRAFSSLIPLERQHVEKLKKSLYTSRFRIEKGYLFRYDRETSQALLKRHGFSFSNTPDGCYEFYQGKPYRIYPTGVQRACPQSHPLHSVSDEALSLWFNSGIFFNSLAGDLNSTRIAYFRNGDLWVMGSPLFYQDEPILNEFIGREKIYHPLAPFLDSGPPTEALYKTHGLQIPEGNYLVLGDNHSCSGDSRAFGFLPESNIQGAPMFLFWPPGARWGYHGPSHLGFPNIIGWGLIIGIVGYILYRNRKRKKAFLFLLRKKHTLNN